MSIDDEQLRQSILRALPEAQKAFADRIARIIVETLARTAAPECLRDQLLVDAEIAPLFSTLAGKQIQVGSSVLSFGEGNHVGDVAIRDIAGGNIITLNVYYGPAHPHLPTPQKTQPSHSQGHIPSGINPFEYGSSVPPGRFYGRGSQKADIRNRIGGISAQCISVVGLRRSGKSSLLRYISERSSEFCTDEQRPLLVLIDMQDRRYHTPVGVTEGLRRSITRQTGASPWQDSQDTDPWAVSDGLESLRYNGRRLIVMLDEFESIQAHLSQFQDWGNDWRAKASAGYMALVVASTRPLPEIYLDCGMTSPFNNIFATTTLGAFEEAEWRQFVGDAFILSGAAIDFDGLNLIDDLAGGMPFYTQMAAALLWQHRTSTSAWAAFEKQAHPRFVELWKDLTPAEIQVLRYASNVPGATVPDQTLWNALVDYGILRGDGRLFSSTFAEFVRGQR